MDIIEDIESKNYCRYLHKKDFECKKDCDVRNCEAITYVTNRLKEILDNSIDVILRINIDNNKFNYINSTCLKLFGYTKDEFIDNGFSWAFSLIHEDDRADFITTINYMKKNTCVQFRFKHKTLGYRWIAGNITIVEKNKKGDTIVTCYCRDITNEITYNDIMRESRRKFRSLYDNLPDMSTSSNNDGIIIMCNDTLLSKTGYSRKEIVGMHIYKLYHSCCIEKVKKIFTHYLETGSIKNERLVIKTKTNDKIYVGVNINAVRDDNNNILHSIATYIDITKQIENERALSEMEHKFKAILEQSPISHELYDRNGLQVKVNAAYERLWGIDKKYTLNKLNIKTDRQVKEIGHDKYVNKAYIDKVPIDIPDYKWDPSKSGFPGRIRWLHTRIFPITNEFDEVIHVVVTHEDITNRKNAERTIIENHRLGAIGEMASSVAHDFNNSLQIILGNIELAKRKSEECSYKHRPICLKYLERSRIAAENTSNRIKILQKFGRVDDKYNISEIIDINSLIDDVIDESKPLFKNMPNRSGNEIIIKKQYTNKNVNVSGNSGELKAVLFNVLKNSMEAMPSGGYIVISTENKKDHVYIYITDTGTGITEDLILKIFQPFFSTKSLGMNRGLGLSGSYNIINEHGGYIRVKDSSTGEGTTMEIKLPESENGIVKKKRIKKMGNEKILKMLWVDDDEMITDFAIEFMEIYGYEGDVVNDSEYAIEYIQSKNYDIVMTDMGMPNMNGVELSKEIRKKVGDKVKIIMFTGWGMTYDEYEKNKHIIDHIVQKPAEINHLNEIINKVMQIKN